jgi:hypothetical protein
MPDEKTEKTEKIQLERTCKVSQTSVVIPVDIRDAFNIQHDDMIKVKFIGKVDIKEKISEFKQ